MSAMSLAERIRAAVAKAASNLDDARVPRENPMPGDVYAFDAGDDVALEWLLVRFHPDDSDCVLLAPMDNCPLMGAPDVELPLEVVGHPLVVRCGETDWLPRCLCAPRLRTGTLPESAVSLVRRRLADLARGRTVNDADETVDDDIEYEEWMVEVAAARRALLGRSRRAVASTETIPSSMLSRTPPAVLGEKAEPALAAETGDSLLANLSRGLEENELRYGVLRDIPGGELHLMVDSIGLRAVWHGPRDRAPRLLHTGDSGEERPIDWLAGPDDRLMRTASAVPWLDGRVVLIVEAGRRRVIAVEP